MKTRALTGHIIGGAIARPLAMNTPSEQAYLEAFDEFADALFRHAYFRLSERERALDLTQETFIKTWEYIRAGNEIRSWKSFLYRILNNLIIDEYRKKKTESLDALAEVDPVRAEVYVATDSRAEKEDRLDSELLIEKIRTYIPRLSPEEQGAITLRYIDGLTLSEIARLEGTTQNVISVRIHRGIEHLKKLCASFLNI